MDLQLFSQAKISLENDDTTDSEDTVTLPKSPLKTNLFPQNLHMVEPKEILKKPAKRQAENDRRRYGKSRLDWFVSLKLTKIMITFLYHLVILLFDSFQTFHLFLSLFWTVCWVVIERIKTFPTQESQDLINVATLSWRTRFNLNDKRESLALYLHLTTHLDKLPRHLSVVLPGKDVGLNVLELIRLSLLSKRSNNHGISLLSIYCQEDGALEQTVAEINQRGQAFHTILNLIPNIQLLLYNVSSKSTQKVSFGSSNDAINLKIAFMTYNNASKPFMARQVISNPIDSLDSLDKLFLTSLNLTEPDVVMVFPNKITNRKQVLQKGGELYGYPPWLLRVAEIFFIPPKNIWISNKVDGILAILGSSVGKLRNSSFWMVFLDEHVVATSFITSLRKFAKVDRRYGK